MKMAKSLKAFLRNFRDTARKAKTRWTITKCGILRCRMGGESYCPITYLLRKTAEGRPFYGTDKVVEAAELLSLGYDDTIRIIVSADSRHTPHKNVRRSLLKAVGLKERTQSL